MSKVVLITGVSSGLGMYTAQYLAEKGFLVYGTSRRSIEPTEGINHLKLDVTIPGEVNAVVQEVLNKEGRIDVLINNAGMGLGGPVEDFTDDEAYAQLNSNFMGTFRMCKAVLPQMRKNKIGLIINISSIGGMMGLPYQGFYSASKYAVEGFSEALRYETQNYGIKTVVVNPGDFKTHFTANRKEIAAITEKSNYYQSYKKSLQIIEKDENIGLKPIVLARKIEKIINTKNPATRYIVASFDQKLAVALKSILPEKLFFKIIGSHYGV